MIVDISKDSIKVVITGKIRTSLDFLLFFTAWHNFSSESLNDSGSTQCGGGWRVKVEFTSFQHIELLSHSLT